MSSLCMDLGLFPWLLPLFILTGLTKSWTWACIMMRPSQDILSPGPLLVDPTISSRLVLLPWLIRQSQSLTHCPTPWRSDGLTHSDDQDKISTRRVLGSIYSSFSSLTKGAVLFSLTTHASWRVNDFKSWRRPGEGAMAFSFMALTTCPAAN